MDFHISIVNEMIDGRNRRYLSLMAVRCASSSRKCSFAVNLERADRQSDSWPVGEAPAAVREGTPGGWKVSARRWKWRHPLLVRKEPILPEGHRRDSKLRFGCGVDHCLSRGHDGIRWNPNIEEAVEQSFEGLNWGWGVSRCWGTCRYPSPKGSSRTSFRLGSLDHNVTPKRKSCLVPSGFSLTVPVLPGCRTCTLVWQTHCQLNWASLTSNFIAFISLRGPLKFTLKKRACISKAVIAAAGAALDEKKKKSSKTLKRKTCCLWLTCTGGLVPIQQRSMIKKWRN